MNDQSTENQNTSTPIGNTNDLTEFVPRAHNQTIEGPVSNNARDEYIYAAGGLKLHFPNKGLEEECKSAAQLLSLSPTDYYGIFTYKDGSGFQPYLYISEQVSWILAIDNQDEYVLLPNTSFELKQFVETLKEKERSNGTFSVAIGILGPIAPEELTNGLPLRMVMCKQLYSFTTADRLTLLEGGESMTIAIHDLIDALSKKPNIGSSDMERAKNFIAYRYSTIHSVTSELSSSKGKEENEFLENLEVKISNSSLGRKIVDIIFTYQKSVSGRQRSFYASVDVTDQFPFLHSSLTDYVSSN
ncbi:MAG: hypothetical protein HRT58_19325 [Crocinitomicaceae bacterium]|nr:hypothetical protein [Flavobacteriales bacterium]NQZ37822.1 hypothetical protein [Crocinitomicaceae bacterium]